jgi:nucleotide-binding universal stress UspA family protein
MTQVDQFESVFRAASKPVYRPKAVDLERVLVVTDLPPNEAEAFGQRIEAFLRHATSTESARFETIAGVEARSTGQLLQLVDDISPSLVCAYRNLFSDGWQWPHSLGEALDLLTQTGEAPVLVLPHPQEGSAAEHALQNINQVMAVTDHLAGDDRLVHWAVAMTQDRGTLTLTHVEDEMVFERYVDVIGKIPSIDTDNARKTIEAQLLKEPQDYIESVRKALGEAGTPITVGAEIRLGNHLSDYRALVEQHEVDMLVLNTRDDEQLAMHGLAYPIAVELRNIPLLML